MSNISQASENLKKKLSFEDYAQPTQKNQEDVIDIRNIGTNQQASKPSYQLDGKPSKPARQ